MIASLLLLGAVVHSFWAFTVAAFIFGVASFANVSPMQMRVMKYGDEAPELAATMNISAFNLANCFGGYIGGKVIDSPHLGAAYGPYAGVGVSLIGLILIVLLESRLIRTSSKTRSAETA